jgi:hypothetical protein
MNARKGVSYLTQNWFIQTIKQNIMKKRIEVLTQKSVAQILSDHGYTYDDDHRYLYDEYNVRYKVAWIHSNSWGQTTFIDLIIV